MKLRTTALAALAFAAIFAKAAPTAVDSSSATLAASLVIEKLRTDILAKPSAEAVILKAMTDSPADYKSRKVAEDALRPVFSAAIASQFETEAKKMLEHLAAPNAVADVFAADFVESSTAIPQKRLDETVGKLYPASFRAARDAACKAQADKITSNILPTEEEIDTLGRAELEKKMTELIAASQSMDIFDENLNFISTAIVKPMLDEAYKQRDAQKAFLQNAPCNSAAPSAIAASLSAALSADIAKRKVHGGVVFAPFASVTNAFLANLAQERSARFFVDHAIAKDPLSQADAEKEIADNAARHKRQSDSENILSGIVCDAMFKTGIDKAVAAAPAPERDEFREFVSGNAGKPVLMNPAKKTVAERIAPVVKAARAAFANRQFAEVFPMVKGDFITPETVDEVAATPNPGRTAENWRSVASLKAIADAERSNPTIDETSALLDGKVKPELNDGVVARNTQHKITDDLLPTVRAEFEGKPLPKLEDIVSFYEGAVSAKWQEGKPAKFIDLFPSTKAKIELLAKSILQDLKKKEEEEKKNEPQPEQKPKPEPKPEEKPKDTPPEETPPEEKPEAQMDCVLLFERSATDIVLSVYVNSRKIDSFNCPYSIDNYKRGINAMVDKATESFMNAVAIEAQRSRVMLTVTLDVRDPYIYYGTVNTIMRRIKKGVKEFGDKIGGVEFGDSE